MEEVSVVFKSVDDTPEHTFTPDVDVTNFNRHFSNLMNNFIAAYQHMFSNVSVLRPASKEERDLHIYVFKDNDPNSDEHKLYEAKKFLYDETAKAFEMLLQLVYPDIEYIKACKEYQQNKVFSNEDVQGYKEDVEMVTLNVREHYQELLDAFMEEFVKEVTLDGTTTKED